MPKPNVKLDRFLERRPTNRLECRDAIRPCPWVSCRHHLAVDINGDVANPGASTIRCNPTLGDDDDVFAMPETCSLDVAERGARTLHEVGDYLGVTRERIRQIEIEALAKLQRNLEPEEFMLDDE